MQEQKYKYIIETGKGLITEIYTLDDIEQGKLNLLNYSAPRKIIARLQFIGLKDKNDVEIYEGDIVKDSSNRIMVIEWDERIGTSRFILKTINTVPHIQAGRYLDTHQWITSCENDIEIIGNIYIELELLESK